MAIRYRTKVESEGGNTWTLHIHDTDHTGGITDFDTARPGFKLTYAGGEDVFHPVIPSTVTVPMYIVDTDGDTFLSDLSGSNEGRFRLTIRKGDSDTSPIWWVGVVTLDNIIIEDVPFPYVVEIQAVDGLQLLSRVPYTLQSNFAIYNVLLHCLEQIGTSDLFENLGTTTYALAVISDLTPDVATFNDPFTDVKLRPAVYDAQNGVYEYDADCETILTEVARSYNSRVFLSEGKFHFLPVARIVNTQSNYPFTEWKFDGTSQVTTGQTFVNVFSGSTNPGVTPVRLAGWSTQFVPPVSVVERPLNFGEGVIISNENVGGTALVPSGATAGTSQQSFTFTTDNEVPTGATFSIRGRAECDADYIGLTGDNRTGRVRIGMKLQVGSYYCKRELLLHPTDSITVQADQFNSTPTQDESVLQWDEPDAATWSTSSGNRVHWGTDLLNFDRPLPNFVTGQDDDTTTALDFTTPPLPSATSGDIVVTFYVVGYDGDGSDMTQSKKDNTNVSLTFALVAGEGYDGNTVVYQATNSNGATEVRQDDVIHLGSQVVFSSQFLYNPAEFYNVNGGLPDWNSTMSPTASVGMHEICVRDMAQYFDKPRRIFSGSFRMTSNQVYLFRSLSYVLSIWHTPCSMTMHADTDIYDVELHELEHSGAPTSTVIKPGPGKPVPVLTSIDSISKRFERGIRNTNSDLSDVIIDVNEVRAGSDSSGGLSSVLLQYLGDVKISGPTNGQILEYNSTAGRWANVTPSGGGADNSLSETNQTIPTGTTRDIVLDGTAASNTFFRITDPAGSIIFSIQNYGTLLNIVQYFGLIAYRSTSTVQGSIALYEAATNGNNYIQLRTPAALSADRVFVLPGDYGSSGDVLTSNGGGVMTWETPFSYITLQSSFYSSDGNFDYIPIGGTLAETSSNQYYNIWTAPASGEVVAATCICSTTTAGSTIITIRKYPIPQNIATDTQTIPATSYTTASFSFSGATFAAGDRLQFGFNPTGTPGGVQITLLIKLNH